MRSRAIHRAARGRPRQRTTWPLVCLDAVPPLSPYLAHARQQPDSYTAQVSFAAVLFEREAYFTALYRPNGLFGSVPPEEHRGYWEPFPVTAAGRDAHRRRSAGVVDVTVPLDLFGLKSEALDGLEQATSETRPQPIGTLLAAAYAVDLAQHSRARDLVDRVLRVAPSHRMALAWAFWSAATSGPSAGGVAARLQRVFGSHWTTVATREREKHAEAVRRLAWRARTAVEGEAFVRFLKTEADYCQEARTTAMASFDASVVPDHLRALIPLVRQFGIGDDACRAYFLRRVSPRERASLRRTVGPHRDAIEEWASGVTAEGSATARSFVWLLEATEEAGPP